MRFALKSIQVQSSDPSICAKAVSSGAVLGEVIAT